MPLGLPMYRERLEAMTAEALDEYYRHAAGLKPTLEMAPIYDRHADLSTLEQVQALNAAGAHRELRRFACEAFVGNGVKQLTDLAANTESALEIEWDGGRIPYRAVRPTLMNEPDTARRRDLHARRCAATEEHLNPLLAEIAERERALTVEAGAPTVSRCTRASATTRPACTGTRRRSWRRPRSSTGGGWTACCASGSGSGWTGRRRPTSRGSSGRPSSTRASRPSGRCRRCGRRWPASGSTWMPSSTSSSTWRHGRTSARARSAHRS